MSSLSRLLPLWAFQDLGLNDPMVFICGPRQVGKTTLAKAESRAYFNWDTPEVKKAYLQDPYFFRSESKLVVFDEIHKRRDWKKLIKGYYDSPARRENFIVTGSGRFDLYQKQGDSLQGRYFSYELHPLTIPEISNKKFKLNKPRNFETWEPEPHTSNDQDLLLLGGYPDPFLRGNERWLRRWENEYIDRLVKEDMRDFSAVEKVDKLELLVRLLPMRVSSPLSHKALSEDIDVSPVAIKQWIRLLQTLYLGFELSPFHEKIHRAIKKERKWYFYPWTVVTDPGSRFENYVAVQLKAAMRAWKEQGYGNWDLFYLRDQDRREIDFVITHNQKPKALIECKLNTTNWSSSLEYYANKLKIPAFILTQNTPTKRIKDKRWILSSDTFLKSLIAD